MKCEECKERENIIDDELGDVVGRKCLLTGTILSSDVDDGLKDHEDDCPLN